MRLRTLHTTLASLTCLALFAPAMAQETRPASDMPKAEEIFEAARKAMGGDALKEIDSMMVKGSMSIMGQSMTMTSYWARGKDEAADKVVVSQSGGGASGGAGSDGETHWANEPMRGYRLITEEEWKAQGSMGGGHFMFVTDDRESESTFETIGVEEFGGKQCYKLKSTEGEVEQYVYFDKEEGLPVGTQIEQEAMPGQTMTMSMTFDGWKAFGDVKFFTQMNLDMGGMMEATLNYDKIEVNKVEESIFELPAEVKKLKEQKDSDK